MVEKVRIQVLRPHSLRQRARWHQPLNKPAERTGKPNEEQQVANVEKRMGIRDLSWCIDCSAPHAAARVGGRRDRTHDIRELIDEKHPEQHPGHIKNNVHPRGLGGFSGSANG